MRSSCAGQVEGPALSVTCSGMTTMSGFLTALGKAYRMWCGGSGGNLRIRRILLRFPGTSRRLRSCSPGLRPRGGGGAVRRGTTVVGGVEARLGERPVVSLDLRRLDGVLEVDAESRAARIQAGARARGSRSSCAARADAAPLPAVLRVLDARRLDRDPVGRSLRDGLHAHRRPGRVGAGDHAARDWRPAGCPAPVRALARPG